MTNATKLRQGELQTFQFELYKPFGRLPTSLIHLLSLTQFGADFAVNYKDFQGKKL